MTGAPGTKDGVLRGALLGRREERPAYFPSRPMSNFQSAGMANSKTQRVSSRRQGARALYVADIE